MSEEYANKVKKTTGIPIFQYKYKNVESEEEAQNTFNTLEKLLKVEKNSSTILRNYSMTLDHKNKEIMSELFRNFSDSSFFQMKW